MAFRPARPSFLHAVSRNQENSVWLFYFYSDNQYITTENRCEEFRCRTVNRAGRRFAKTNCKKPKKAGSMNGPASKMLIII